MTDRLRLDGVRVLIVDDAPFVRDVVTDILQQDGAVVTAVETAEKALEILQRERPTVLLSDLSMPGKGGYWLIGQVRALPPERGGATPAAAFTAYSSPAASTSWSTWSQPWPAPRSHAVSTPRRRRAERGSKMSETEPLEFVQIAAAKEHLYGMTRSGAVWRYDDIRRLWEALSMRGLTPLKQPA